MVSTKWGRCKSREDKSRLKGAPKSSLSKNMKFTVTPLVLTPFVPFRRDHDRPRTTPEVRFARLCDSHPLSAVRQLLPRHVLFLQIEFSEVLESELFEADHFELRSNNSSLFNFSIGPWIQIPRILLQKTATKS